MHQHKKIDWQEVQSSNISAIAHNARLHTVCVKFRNGGLYTYMGVSDEIYLNLANAESVGQYLNNVVKAFPYTRWESEDALENYLNL